MYGHIKQNIEGDNVVGLFCSAVLAIFAVLYVINMVVPNVF